jgi:Est1 DNA/RNA binding domain
MPSEEQYRSYYSFLRLNVRMLFMLLQLLQPELAGPRDDDDAPDVTGRETENNTESITAVTRRILPALRQYSTWLVSRAEIISALDGNTALTVHIKEMWSIYCSTLSLLVVAFPPENLMEIDYLLEEDAATVGLKPFRDSELCKLYTTNDGQLKPRTTDPNVERSHPNLEMRSRVRDLLRDAMVLAHNANKEGKKIAPIHLIGVKFYFLEEGLPLSPMNDQPLNQPVPSPEVQHSVNASMVTDAAHIQDGEIPRSPSVAPSDSHQSMSTDMYQMVDELVSPTAGQRNKNPQGSNETSYGMHSLTAAEIFAPMDLNARPASRQKASPTLFPRLPGIYNSPFSPQPGELPATSPDRPGTAVRLSSLQLSSSQQQMAAATVLDQPTGYSHGQRLSWGNKIPPSNSLPTSTPRQSVSQQLQQSLAQQYNNPPSSTVFSHPSSLYSGTPLGCTNRGHPYGDFSHNASTNYGGSSGFDSAALLQSSIWNGSQQGWAGPAQTPPNGQG